MGEKCNSGKIEREAMTLFNECVVTVVLLNSEHYIRESIQDKIKFKTLNRTHQTNSK